MGGGKLGLSEVECCRLAWLMALYGRRSWLRTERYIVGDFVLLHFLYLSYGLTYQIKKNSARSIRHVKKEEIRPRGVSIPQPFG